MVYCAKDNRGIFFMLMATLLWTDCYCVLKAAWSRGAFAVTLVTWFKTYPKMIRVGVCKENL